MHSTKDWVLKSDIDDKKSLVDLSRVYKLPKENILSDEYIIFSHQANEIIKKIAKVSQKIIISPEKKKWKSV